MFRLWIKSTSPEKALEFVYARGLSNKNATVNYPLIEANNSEQEQIIDINDCDAALGIIFPKVLNWYAEVSDVLPFEDLAEGSLVYYLIMPGE